MQVAHLCAALEKRAAWGDALCCWSCPHSSAPCPPPRVTYPVWSLPGVQSCRLPSPPTCSTVNPDLAKQTLLPLPNRPQTPLRADPSSATSRGDLGKGLSGAANPDQH